MKGHLVTRVCGHDEKIVLYRSVRQSQWQIAKAEKELCESCLFEQRKEASNVIAAEDAEQGLAELKGTPKQIVWALQLRRKLLPIFETSVENAKGDEEYPLALEFLDWLKTKNDSAEWWIDNKTPIISSCFNKWRSGR